MQNYSISNVINNYTLGRVISTRIIPSPSSNGKEYGVIGKYLAQAEIDDFNGFLLSAKLFVSYYKFDNSSISLSDGGLTLNTLQILYGKSAVKKVLDELYQHHCCKNKYKDVLGQLALTNDFSVYKIKSDKKLIYYMNSYFRLIQMIVGILAYQKMFPEFTKNNPTNPVLVSSDMFPKRTDLHSNRTSSNKRSPIDNSEYIGNPPLNSDSSVDSNQATHGISKFKVAKTDDDSENAVDSTSSSSSYADSYKANEHAYSTSTSYQPKHSTLADTIKSHMMSSSEEESFGQVSESLVNPESNKVSQSNPSHASTNSEIAMNHRYLPMRHKDLTKAVNRTVKNLLAYLKSHHTFKVADMVTSFAFNTHTRNFTVKNALEYLNHHKFIQLPNNSVESLKSTKSYYGNPDYVQPKQIWI